MLWWSVEVIIIQLGESTSPINLSFYQPPNKYDLSAQFDPRMACGWPISIVSQFSSFTASSSTTYQSTWHSTSSGPLTNITSSFLTGQFDPRMAINKGSRLNLGFCPSRSLHQTFGGSSLEERKDVFLKQDDESPSLSSPWSGSSSVTNKAWTNQSWNPKASSFWKQVSESWLSSWSQSNRHIHLRDSDRQASLINFGNTSWNPKVSSF